MQPTKSNPAYLFFDTYKSEILSTRQSLFSEIDSISPYFGNEIRNMFNLKLESNKQLPPLGEMFPWIIKDLTQMESSLAKRVSVSWLAVYLYTLFIDDYLDNQKVLSPEKFLAGSILAKTGLLNIGKIIYGTKYENLVDKALSQSSIYQLEDVRQQKNKTVDNKAEYSEGKNRILLACAGALASLNNKHADFIIEFTNSLLLSLQYLDDIADFEQDAKSSNYTFLLSNAFPSKEINNLTNRELLFELLVSGSLYKVLSKIETLLSHSFGLIKQYRLDVHDTQSSIQLFLTLQSIISSFKKFIKKEALYITHLPAPTQQSILDKTEQYIKKIAQST